MECNFSDSINHNLEKNIFAQQGGWHLSSHVPVSKNTLLSIEKGLTIWSLEFWDPTTNKKIKCANLCILYI